MKNLDINQLLNLNQNSIWKEYTIIYKNYLISLILYNNFSTIKLEKNQLNKLRKKYFFYVHSISN